MKIVTIVGARPQFIKAASLSRAISQYSEIDEIIVHTGQHFDINMSDIFFEEMQIPKPNYYLDVNGLNHGAMTGQMLIKIEEILLKEQPDWVLVYGDTNTTLAGALAAKKLHFRVAHVEAGLRSFNMSMPEEINRILVDRISDVLFCPTDTAIGNLQNEGFEHIDCTIVKSGDIMEDSAKFYLQYTKKPDFELPNKFILATLHRAETTDSKTKLQEVINALEDIAMEMPIVMPLHPRTTNKINQYGISLENIQIIPPVGYFDMLWLINHCELVMTDSGGLQKEAYFFDKFCITLRAETEWVELIRGGYNFLCDTNALKISSAYQEIKGKTFLKKESLYGNGQAASQIINFFLPHNQVKS
jgi:UDP-GlcNAc3NAcA epimerase